MDWLLHGTYKTAPRFIFGILVLLIRTPKVMCICIGNVSILEVYLFWKCISIGSVSLLKAHIFGSVSLVEVWTHSKCIFTGNISLLEVYLLSECISFGSVSLLKVCKPTKLVYSGFIPLLLVSRLSLLKKFTYRKIFLLITSIFLTMN